MTVLPLKNLRVINFGWVWASPVLGHTLGDMGAQVIKIESRKRPDVIRVLPPMLKDQYLESYFAATTFRSQMGIALDLTSQKGQEIARELVRSADVVIENFSPGVMKRYGLDYPSVKKLRPDVIMISLTAAGQDGPLSKIVTYGNIISCLAGLDGLQGYIGADEPTAYGTSIPDPMMGLLGAYVVLAALRHRAKTGKGQYIDVCQWEATAATVGGPLMDYLFNKRITHPKGNRDDMMAPHGVYPCKGDDSWVSIAVKTDDEWRQLCAVMDKPELLSDERFGDLFSRHMHHGEIDEIISRWTATQQARRVTTKLQRVGVAAFPSMSAKDIFEDKHFKERGNWVEVDHPLMKTVIYGMPYKLSATPGGIQSPATMVGQYNDEVYGGILGLSQEEIAKLTEERIFY